MERTQTFGEIISNEDLAGPAPEEHTMENRTEGGPETGSSTHAGKRTRVKLAIIYALTTIIPLLVMFYIVQTNVILRKSMGIVSVSTLAFIALGIALLGGGVMKELWGKVNQAMSTIEKLRKEGDSLTDISMSPDGDEIDRIPTVVTHLVEVAKRQMRELKASEEKEQRNKKRLEDLNTRLEQLTREDSLTGLGNRRGFDEHIEQEISRTKRYDRNLALAMIDIDFFKNYNDSVGHLAGDKALATIGAIIRESIRETDLAFRYGGEELAVVFPETSTESAASVAERIRSAVEKHSFEGESSQPEGSLTVSIGVSVMREDLKNLEDLHKCEEEFVSASDKALYKAKSLGRNRVVTR